MTPNTQITPETVGMLKSGDVFKHVAADVFRTLRRTSGEWPDLWLHFEEDPDSAVLCDRFVFDHRPAASSPSAVGVGEISQGQRAFEAMRDHGDQSLIAGKSRKAWSDLTDAEQKQWQDDATERPSLYRTTPTAALSAGDATEKVDWERVGPKLVEALERIAADGEPYRNGYCQTDIAIDPALTAQEAQDVARDALAATQPQSNGE